MEQAGGVIFRIEPYAERTPRSQPGDWLLRRWMRAITLLAALLVVKVTLGIVLAYRDYFSPNFRAGILLGPVTLRLSKVSAASPQSERAIVAGSGT